MSVFSSILLSVSLLTSSPNTENANISVLIQDAETHEIIDQHRAENVVPPASVMKLLTTAAMLELYGPDFRFSTTLEYTGTISQGVLKGDLYVRGGCDPGLGSQGKIGFLYQWARELKKAGISSIEGKVIADMTMLDTEAQNPAWLCEDVGNYYAPGIFALNYYDNTMNIVLRSAEPGSLAVVTKTEPQVDDLIFINHIRCDRIQYDGAYVHGLPYSKERYLTGVVPSNLGTFGVKGDLPNPGLLLVQHFTGVLEESGITVNEPPAYCAVYNPMSPPRQVIYTHYSAPLSELICETNTQSNNLYAESMFRFLGTRYGLPGTIPNSQDVVKEFWRLKGIDVRGILVKDGCGLAPQDAVSAKTWVELLNYMRNSQYVDSWMASLPVSGQSGTLRSLCAKTALDGRIHAKSGSIAGTKNYAGYIELPNGKTWVFAVLVNSGQGKSRAIQNVIQNYLLDVYQQHQ